MKTNIFLNSYSQPENKLTYNFLSIVELLNDSKFCGFLTDLQLADQPVVKINLVYGGGKSNPDGSIKLKRLDGKLITVYFENKTYRLGLTADQVINHLDYCGEDDLLLIITPRVSDAVLLKSINNSKIKFRTWGDISRFLNKYDSPIARQFVEYGKLSGEFDELGELSSDDIQQYCSTFKIDFEKKIDNILHRLTGQLDLNMFGFDVTNRKRQNAWGRNSIEINYKQKGFTYNQWYSIAYYYNTWDHTIQFKNDVPEMAVFFDIDPAYKHLLQNDPEFIGIVNRLQKYGFENNLDNGVINNPWRLLFYRMPVCDFDVLNVTKIVLFVEEVFKKLLDAGSMEHPYFKELSRSGLL